MRRLICAIACLAALCLCAGAAGLAAANPWVETTPDGLMQALGVEFGVPDGADVTALRMLSEQELAEMRFRWYDMDYVARIQPADAFTDISGLYVDWALQDDCPIQRCDGRVMRGSTDGKTVDLCLWYDARAGLMYAVSAAGDDLDGFDITAAAEAIYIPATAE